VCVSVCSNNNNGFRELQAAVPQTVHVDDAAVDKEARVTLMEEADLLSKNGRRDRSDGVLDSLRSQPKWRRLLQRCFWKEELLENCFDGLSRHEDFLRSNWKMLCRLKVLRDSVALGLYAPYFKPSRDTNEVILNNQSRRCTLDHVTLEHISGNHPPAETDSEGLGALQVSSLWSFVSDISDICRNNVVEESLIETCEDDVDDEPEVDIRRSDSVANHGDATTNDVDRSGLRSMSIPNYRIVSGSQTEVAEVVRSISRDNQVCLGGLIEFEKTNMSMFLDVFIRGFRVDFLITPTNGRPDYDNSW